MKPNEIVDQLRANRSIFKAIFAAIREDMIEWRPAKDKWSFLEVACHLLDEEREDFRARISSLFRDPTQPFEPIDPQGWVDSRYYAEQDFQSVCDGFLEERNKSLEWLKYNLDQDWSQAYVHPKFGPMSAIYLLNNWLAHDHLHINQLNRMSYRYFKSRGMELDYAGPEL